MNLICTIEQFIRKDNVGPIYCYRLYCCPGWKTVRVIVKVYIIFIVLICACMFRSFFDHFQGLHLSVKSTS